MTHLAKPLALALPVLLLTAACGTGSPANPNAEDDLFMGHVHGIGIDPGNGAVYVAAHTGLFRLDDERPTRVADRWQDTMAFAVIGAGHFVGSGHPDLREHLPTHLGLIESTDAGQTWQPVALEGDADFHALEAAGDTIYGYDSVTGELLAAGDDRTFRSIARVQATDLAADPTTEDRVLATTRRGLLAIDARTGRTAAIDSARLAYIDWPRADLLVGATPDGRILRSVDGGGSWAEAGRLPGEPAALEVDTTAWYAATDAGLFRSTDEGESWAQIG